MTDQSFLLHPVTGEILRPGIWSHFSPTWKEIDTRLVYGSTLRDYEARMTEAVSDACVSEMLSSRSCNISESCWRTMTAEGYSAYQLSHEVFYLSLGRGGGCGQEMERMALKHGQQSVELLEDTFCANMLAVNLDIARRGFPPIERDLFLENGEGLFFSCLVLLVCQ